MILVEGIKIMINDITKLKLLEVFQRIQDQYKSNKLLEVIK